MVLKSGQSLSLLLGDLTLLTHGLVVKSPRITYTRHVTNVTVLQFPTLSKDAVDTSPDSGGQNVLKTFEINGYSS